MTPSHKSVCAPEPIQRYRSSLIRQIFGLARTIHEEAKYSAEDLHTAIHEDIINWRIGKKPSLRTLTIRQLENLVNEYRLRHGAKPYQKKTTHYHSNPEGQITENMARFMEDLFAELGYNDLQRAKFSAHQIGHPVPFNRGECLKIIEGLKAIRQKRLKTIPKPTFPAE